MSTAVGTARFDQFVMVDWSAASTPKRGADSVWVAHADAPAPGCSASRLVVSTDNPPTRHEAEAVVAALVRAALDRGQTTLVGLDFSFGYPAGFAEVTAGLRPASESAVGSAVGSAGKSAWRGTWDLLAGLVHDGPDNTNDRFEAADSMNGSTGIRLFWGRPQGGRHDRLAHLPAKDIVPGGMAPNPCARLRLAEQLAGSGIKSAFQLFGRGTVGGQVLVGIPWLCRLVSRFDQAVAVWPFETGFVADPLAGQVTGPRAWGAPTGPVPRVVIAEIWPSAFPLDASVSPIRDEAQVVSTLRAMADRQQAGWGRWFDPPSVGTSGSVRHSALEEEGWILGVH